MGTPSYPPGIWLFTYQSTIYFATSPTSFVGYVTYLSGPTGGVLSPLTQFAKMSTGTLTFSGSNQVTSLSSSVCVNLTSSTAILLYLYVNANAQAQAGGTNTSNTQATYITATRIG